MKTLKRILPLFCILVTSLAARADILFDDASNYPYANGLIETQGQWYVYSPAKPHQDAFVTNNVLLLNSTNYDSVATPTNGFPNSTEFNYVSFRLNVTQLPGSAGGSYIFQFQSTNDTANVCHLFVDTLGTSVPGTYRLGIANIATEFGGLGSLAPPINYPEDLATDVWYNVVILYDPNQNDLTYAGATLWINPSENDFLNVPNGNLVYDDNGIPVPGLGVNFVYATDRIANSDTNQLDINIAQVGFGPYAGNEGISNIIVGTTFDDVNSTNLPVFGIQPQSGTNYSGNPLTLSAVASGVDLTYQWYSQNNGKLSDISGEYTGSTNDILIINDQTNTDTYYCIVTDAYGNTAQSSNAVDTVNTTPTPVFFPTTAVAVTNVGNLFTTTSFNNPALGTGPIYYQWYFASNIISSIITNTMPNPTNSSLTITNYYTNFEQSAYTALSGQTSPLLSLDLVDYTYAGYYYVAASNSIDGGTVQTIAVGPTNSLVELAPTTATIAQLHNLMVSIQPEILGNEGGTIYINTNNVTVSGYVTTYGGFGTSYSEYNIQDASGYGIEVYLGGHGNTNTPPVGSYVTVSGPIEVYNTQLEIAPNSQSAVTNSPAPVIPITPVLANSIFNDLATHGLGTNAIMLGDKLLTFTNVYFYGTPTGGPFGSGYGPSSGAHDGIGGIFLSNSYTEVFFTANGPYSTATGNTNTMELYQFAEDYGKVAYGNYRINPFDDKTIPTNCFQFTGAYSTYGGTAQFEPSRLADYVVTAPTNTLLAISTANKAATITWMNQVGSTYSVNTATNILGPWTQAAYGLTYYPTNGAFTDTNTTTQTKFYYITSP